MAEMFIRLKKFTITAAGATTDIAAQKVIEIKKGERILFGSINVLVAADAASTATCSVGDSSSATALLAATNLKSDAVTTGTLVDMAALASHGKVYTADDNVTFTFTHGSNATAVPSVRVIVGVGRGEQF